MPTQQEAKDSIQLLVDRFHEHVDEYRRGAYNEHQTRVDYINPFWKALGWDMDNEQGHAEAYRQVIHEDKLKIGGSTKAPDYCFTVNGQRKFFVDAKKPSIYVKGDPAPAYQVRRYGWSARMPIAIVSDFEEFAVYDCKVKPNKDDKSSTARINYHTYREYMKEFDYFWDTFSWEAVTKGRFDKFVTTDTKKRGTATVDEQFLKDIEQWRTYLATSIALNNKALNEDEINFAVQRTIDRIIFLRMCEDRGVEPHGELKHAAEKGETYPNLFTLFRKADEKYNSGLFDLKEDRITPGLTVDNKVLKNIIKELYYPWCDYEFSVMPADILGSVYERFLGKTIRLTPAHHAKIDEKPEVRKAGGVYYTPKYVVDYIVENTLGTLLNGTSPKDPSSRSRLPSGEAIPSIVAKKDDAERKRTKPLTPDQVSALRICDPACGSGSFLIGAYEYLINWHRDYYMPEFMRLTGIAESKGKSAKERTEAIRKRAKLPLTPDGFLTTAEKKRILLNNIYGVDIDAQAVEVTKLNLLLKAMEGETTSSINAELTFGNQVLPNLKDNIKCGNSLIGFDYYDGAQASLPFGEGRGGAGRINAFDWQKGFPDVFKKGGFDVVIGNPPYVRQELLGDQKEYFRKHYKVYHGVADLYTYFFERGISLLNDNGLYGIIVANKWMRANYGEPLRNWLKQQTLIEITDFGDLRVFQDATTYPCIVLAAKPGRKNNTVRATEVKTLKFDSLTAYVAEHAKNVTKASLDDRGWQLVSDAEGSLLKKLSENSMPLGEYVKGNIYRGVLTGLNEAFVIDEATKRQLIEQDPMSAEVIKPFLAGRDIKRYAQPQSDKYLIFTRRGIDIDVYPAIKNHLLRFKEQLTPKPANYKGNNWPGRKPGQYKWYEIQDAVDYYLEFEKPKIMLPDIAIQPEASYDMDGYYCVNTAYIIPVPDRFLLAVLNSRLTEFYYTSISPTIRGGYLRFIRQYLETIPVTNNRNDEITSLVDQLLTLNKQLQAANLETEREQIQRAIDHAERKVDELVYELYGLTEEEVRVVEGASK